MTVHSSTVTFLVHFFTSTHASLSLLLKDVYFPYPSGPHQALPKRGFDLQIYSFTYVYCNVMHLMTSTFADAITVECISIRLFLIDDHPSVAESLVMPVK